MTKNFRNICIFVVSFPFFTIAGNFNHNHIEWAEFIRSFTVTKGLKTEIKYLDIKTNQNLLNTYLATLDSISEDTFSNWSVSAKTAYLINAYNALSIKLIVDYYPLKSLSERSLLWGLFSFYKRDLAFVKGRLKSLSQIEEELSRLETWPLSLFALACPSISCPNLRFEPYTETWVTEQIKDATQKFFSDPSKNNIVNDKKILMVSPLLDKCFFEHWFHCFGKSIEKKTGSLNSFITSNFKNANTLDHYKIEFLKYNNKLNDFHLK